MKRFHVHVHVADLGASIRFYSQLFGAALSYGLASNRGARC